MHIRAVTRALPQSATNVQQVLDIILQIINVVSAAATLFGINISNLFQKNTTT